MVQPTLFGDENLHLFTFFTSIGYGTGTPPSDYVKSYNLVKKGFVQYSGATSFPGATISAATLSSVNGPQYECLIEWTLGTDNNWWLYACNGWQGYLPTATSTTVVASKRINYGTLSTYACNTNWFGEAATNGWKFYGVWGTVDMGSGKYAGDGFGKAAYIRAAQYLSYPERLLDRLPGQR